MLLRHAKSSWADPALADVDRPLNRRGERAAAAMGAYLREHDLRPDVVLCSPARRTRQTLAAVEAELGDGFAVELAPDVYGGGPAVLLELLRALPDSAGAVMVVGHNPGLEELALLLAAPGNERARVGEKFPTGALAVLEAGCERWADLAPGGAELVAFVVPRELEGS